jgi:hypothetical protein
VDHDEDVIGRVDRPDRDLERLLERDVKGVDIDACYLELRGLGLGFFQRRGGLGETLAAPVDRKPSPRTFRKFFRDMAMTPP